MKLEQPDFHAEFDQRTRFWTVSWKWSDEQPPGKLYNRVPEYKIPPGVCGEYDKELQTWIKKWMTSSLSREGIGPPKVSDPINVGYPA